MALKLVKGIYQMSFLIVLVEDIIFRKSESDTLEGLRNK